MDHQHIYTALLLGLHTFGNYNKGLTASKVCSNITNTQIIVWTPILFNLELGAGNITNTID